MNQEILALAILEPFPGKEDELVEMLLVALLIDVSLVQDERADHVDSSGRERREPSTVGRCRAELPLRS